MNERDVSTWYTDKFRWGANLGGCLCQRYTGTINLLGFILLSDPSTINPIETTSTIFILKDNYSSENNTA